jgi:hypothetical protein
MAKRQRHPLILHRHRIGSWRWASLLLAGVAALLFWFRASVPLFFGLMGWATIGTLALTALGGVLFMASWLLPRLAYVEVRAKSLLVSVPGYQLAIGFGRITNVRTTTFEPQHVSSMQRELTEKFRGRPVVILDLKSWPLPRWWLRLWLDWFSFPEGAEGLQFMVTDWMALSRQIEGARATWASERAIARRPKLTLADKLTSARPK